MSASMTPIFAWRPLCVLSRLASLPRFAIDILRLTESERHPCSRDPRVSNAQDCGRKCASDSLGGLLTNAASEVVVDPPVERLLLGGEEGWAILDDVGMILEFRKDFAGSSKHPAEAAYDTSGSATLALLRMPFRRRRNASPPSHDASVAGPLGPIPADEHLSQFLLLD